MPGPGRPAVEKSGTPVQTGTNRGCTGLNSIGKREKCQSGTPVQEKRTPLLQKAEVRSKKEEGGAKNKPATTLQTHIKEFLSGQSFSADTQRGYRQRLERFLAFLTAAGARTPREVTKAHINAYAATLEGRSDSTRAAYLATVKTFFTWLTGRDILLLNPAALLRIPRPSSPGPLPLSEEEMERLLDAPDTGTVLGLRDRAMLEVLYSTGMRSGELLALTLRDVDLGEQLCFIRRGKGGGSRWAPLTEAACRILEAYLERARPRLVAGGPSDYLFPSKFTPRLGIPCLDFRCRRYAKQAGIERRVWPHLLRHTAACHLLQSGASLFHVQMFLGHAWVSTTQRYTHVADGRVREVYRRCHPRA